MIWLEVGCGAAPDDSACGGGARSVGFDAASCVDDGVGCCSGCCALDGCFCDSGMVAVLVATAATDVVVLLLLLDGLAMVVSPASGLSLFPEVDIPTTAFDDCLVVVFFDGLALFLLLLLLSTPSSAVFLLLVSAFVTDGISVLASKVVLLVDVVVMASTDDRFFGATDSLLPLVAAASERGGGSVLLATLPATAPSATAFSSGTLAAESMPLPSCCVALASIIGTAISSAFVAGRFSDMVAPPWFDAPTGDSAMIIYPCSSRVTACL